jgi:hypothetical protein
MCRWVVLSVTDTGTGIPDDVRPHLFEPFFTTKEVGKGTGLGLPTVYGIVTGAGGHLRFHTAPGQGTTFRAYLPAAHPEAGTGSSDGDRPSRREPDPLATKDRRPGKSWTVLVVEDLPAVRDLSTHILTDSGFAVISAEDG